MRSLHECRRKFKTARGSAYPRYATFDCTYKYAAWQYSLLHLLLTANKCNFNFHRIFTYSITWCHCSKINSVPSTNNLMPDYFKRINVFLIFKDFITKVGWRVSLYTTCFCCWIQIICRFLFCFVLFLCQNYLTTNYLIHKIMLFCVFHLYQLSSVQWALSENLFWTFQGFHHVYTLRVDLLNKYVCFFLISYVIKSCASFSST